MRTKMDEEPTLSYTREYPQCMNARPILETKKAILMRGVRQDGLQPPLNYAWGANARVET